MEIHGEYLIDNTHAHHLTTRQLWYLAAACRAKHIVDLGGGDGSLARFLLENGAQSALNIDKEKDQVFRTKPQDHPGLTHYWGYFADFIKDTARLEAQRGKIFVVSWPPTNAEFSTTAIPLLELASEIIFIGLNDGTTACGSFELWDFLVNRELIQEILDQKNDILHYRNQEAFREPTLIESIGLGEHPYGT